MKLTPQRLAILKFLEGNTSHPSAEDIFNAVMKTHPTISLATVYNTLDVLKKRGEIVELTIDPSRRHYDPDTKRHHHIACIVCGKISDISEEGISIRFPENSFGDFRVVEWQMNISGVCRGCEEKEGGGGVMTE